VPDSASPALPDPVQTVLANQTTENSSSCLSA
jgi:hypothetical protein